MKKIQKNRMMPYSDDDMLMLSGIQHFRFCPRQWALIHLEQQWDDNRLTVEGSLMHKHVDDPFSGRNRRPPKDAVNAMLSLAYTLVTNEMAAALETVGLDPYVGFLHSLRPGRTSLALDMIEEMRAYMGDRFVLSLINLQLDSIRIYFLNKNENRRIVTMGKETSYSVNDAIII